MHIGFELLMGIVLGAVQGATEFLPVSSTGHLILVRELFGVDDGNALAFDAVLHLATAGAVILYFFGDIWVLFQTLLRKLSRLPVNDRDLTYLTALAVGTVPAVILGLFLEETMETAFRSPLLVAAVLVAGSIFFMFAEYRYQNQYHEQQVDVRRGFKIGLFQALALIPGMSRSGATIAGGMLLGMSRSDAARFAFMLSIPVILGAGLKKLFELFSSPEQVAWAGVLAGAVTAFIVGLLAVHFMLAFVRKHTLWPFIWYRIILAGFVLLIVFST